MPEFMGFIIDEPDIPEGKQRCKACGELVGRGIIPSAVHWNDCEGKGVVEAMKVSFENAKKEGRPFTIEDVNKILPLTPQH